MAIDWTKIRTFNKSQHNAFEELVCQLAREEPAHGRSKFYRVAAPDGGVEAYATLVDGKEIGWQAKYFPSMGPKQWDQVAESFHRALITHPELTKYYVCMPLDRQDPRRPDELWFMDKWNAHSAKWVAAAAKMGRQVEIEYWGSSELLHRLSQEKHAGRRLFWFSELEFSDSWFRNQVENSIENLGERYTSDLNIKLELSRNFDSLCRNAAFRESTQKRFEILFANLRRALSLIHKSERLTQESCTLAEGIALLEVELYTLTTVELAFIDVSAVRTSLESMTEAVRKCAKQLPDSRLSFDEILGAVQEFDRFLSSPLLSLAGRPAMALVGEAGIGKSHLLADVASNLISNGRPCIFLLGQHFRTEEAPWTQILKNLLRLSCGEHDLLGALSARAEALGERMIFLIDAVNEGRGAYFWPDHIQGFIKDFAHHPWLGLAISVRTSYERLILSDNLITKNNVVKVRHRGFSGNLDVATSTFFARYKIDPPGVPFLHAEYENPLFLKLLCEGLKKANLHAIPEGYAGISSVIEFFLNGVEKSLSRPSAFNYPEALSLAKRVINKIVAHKIDNDISYLSYHDAFTLTSELVNMLPEGGRFLDALISEGAISKNLYWFDDGRCEEGIYFSYERFEDHLSGNYLLGQSDLLAGKAVLDQGTLNLGTYIGSHKPRQGILEALSIQLPERTGLELFQVLQLDYSGSDAINEAFIYSLAWRPKDTISKATIQYLNEYLLTNSHGFDMFFQMVYTVVGDPQHAFNGDQLHRYFMQYSLAVRDSFWVPYLHDQDNDDSALNRLVNWSQDPQRSKNLSGCSRVLFCQALAWLLPTTNIYLRNSTTRALVHLFRGQLNVAVDVLKCFERVDDPYISERILAAAYGAVLNSSDKDAIARLAYYLVDSFFGLPEVFPHALARDYARNIVEYANFVGIPNVDVSRVRPPYKSALPARFPDNAEIDKYKYNYEAADFRDHCWSQNAIISSMTTEYGRGVGSYGDFGRYTFQRAFAGWPEFDPQALSNWACKLIFDKYGYDVELHGRFDRSSSKGDRSHNTAERIGKKYQWISFFEVFARVADNYMMEDPAAPRDEARKIWYDGPWVPFIRNFDPTTVSEPIMPGDPISSSWWRDNESYDAWSKDRDTWLTSSDNLPDIKRLVSRIDEQSEKWLVLETSRSWSEPVAGGADPSLTPHERLWYQIRSYLVHESDAEKVVTWARTKHLMGRWFPERNDQYQIFAREYYWSPAYRFLSSPYFGRVEWEELREEGIRGRVVGKVMPTTEGHRWEDRADESLAYLAPCEAIFQGMQLRASSRIGEWADIHGRMQAFDPSVGAATTSELLVNQSALLKFLRENKLKIFWTILGEKQIFGGVPPKSHPRWLELSAIADLQGDELNVTLSPRIFEARRG